MIAPPSGWTTTRCEGGLTLFPPGGPAVGALRYIERLRPLRPVAQLISEHRVPRDWVMKARTPIEQLVTHEGEYAAFQVLTGTIGGDPAERSFGFVFGDDFYARLTGVCVQPDQFATLRDTARELIMKDAHVLGVRRRRFLYRPPDGWQAVRDLFDATWIPPDFPDRDISILVSPAIPSMPGLVHELLLATARTGGTLDEVMLETATHVEAPGGLMGTRWRLRTGAARESTLVVLEDDRYVYALRCDHASARAAEAWAALEKLLASVAALPRPGVAGSRGSGSQATLTPHWVD